MPDDRHANEVSELRYRLAEVEEELRSLKDHQAELARATSQARVMELLDQIGDGFFALDTDFRITYYNQRAADLLGRPAKQVLGRRLFDAFPEARGSIFEQYYTEAMRTRESCQFKVHFEVKPLVGWYEVQVYPNLRGLSVFFRIVTEQEELRSEFKNLEARYLQAQKLEAIGRLAGGVAHDLNNLLSPILGYGDMLLESFGEDDRRRLRVDRMVEAGKRARDLVHQLLAFSRKQSLAVGPVAINDVVTNVRHLLERTLVENITVTLELGEDLPLVAGDIGQLEQVLVNLVINARDAMPEGGTLTITTGRDAGSRLVGDGVELSVADTGCGMSPEVLEHIFEPFFTTKEAGHGTGLGLATAYGIIRQHNGLLEVTSEPGTGSRFRCILPLAIRIETAPSAVTVKHLRHAGVATILVVEDEPLVRDMTREILEEEGHLVLTAGDADEAWRLTEDVDALDLLLSDVVLPRSDGPALTERLRERFPRMKIMFMSGYNDNVIGKHGVLPEGVAFLAKPFTIDDLLTKVAVALAVSRG